MSYTLKKSLGQHFLHDENICQQIVSSLQGQQQPVLEIGPGGGAITKYLLLQPFSHYQCVELDKEKVDYLISSYPSLSGKIIHDDFLQINLPYPTPFDVIGNFPYNISTQIVFKILDWKDQVNQVVGMFQKEVAWRIAAPHGKKDYGILSVLTQCYYDVEYLFDVPASAFTPPPKVISGVIRMTKKETPLFGGNYHKFKSFVKAAFSQRRKTLRNSLKSSYKPEDLQVEVFGKRAEQLSPLDFVNLFNQLNPV